MTLPAPVLALFSLAGLLMLLNWVVWAVACFWIWKKTQGVGYLVMLVAACVFALDFLLMMFGAGLGGAALAVIASLGLTTGFVLTVKPQISGELDALRKKVHELTAGTPPPAPPSPPPPAGSGTPPAPPAPPAPPTTTA